MRVWVVRTRTRLPDGYMMLHIYIPAGRNIIPYPSPYRVKPVGYSGFGYPLSCVDTGQVQLSFATTRVLLWLYRHGGIALSVML
jgi:hypothetical protein